MKLAISAATALPDLAVANNSAGGNAEPVLNVILLHLRESGAILAAQLASIVSWLEPQIQAKSPGWNDWLSILFFESGAR